METEVREWLDRLAIQDLISRYSDAVTRADWQQCEAPLLPGIYYDDVARIDGKWKFSRRLFVAIYAGTGRVTGDLRTPRSALLRPDGA